MAQDKVYITRLTVHEAMLCHESISGITIRGKDAVMVGALMTKLNNFIERNITVSQGGKGENLEQFKPQPGGNSHQGQGV